METFVHDLEMEKRLDQAVLTPELPYTPDNRPMFSAWEVGKVVRPGAPVLRLDTQIFELEKVYNRDPALDFLPIMDEHEVIRGYVLRSLFKAKLGQNAYSRNILLRPGRYISEIMQDHAVVLDARLTLPEASERLMDRPGIQLYDPFAIAYHGKYLGTATVKDVLRGLNFYQSKNLRACVDAQQRIQEFTPPLSDRFGFAGRIRQLDDLGGDFMLARRVNADLYFIAQGDVCGKGLPASNMVNTILSAIRSTLPYIGPHFKKGFSLKHAKMLVNTLNRFIANATPMEMYATAALFIADFKKGHLHYFDFGHNLVFLKRGAKVFTLPRNDLKSEVAPFFGMDPEAEARPISVKFSPGDMVVTYSDGFSEAMNKERQEFGEEAIWKSLKEKGWETTDEIADGLLEEVTQFKDGYRWTDDASIAVFQLDPPGSR